MRKLLALASVALATYAFAANQTISINFQGRGSDAGNPATTPLAPTDVAGVVPVANWNNIDDHYNLDGSMATFNGANDGTSAPLKDSTGAATPVTLTFYANDSWYNDVAFDSISTPNARLMNGIIKANPGDGRDGPLGTFTWNNLAKDGIYDLYIYFNMNGDNVVTDFYDESFSQYFHVTETHKFADTDTFVEAKNTDPNGTPDLGNYVHMTGLSTFGGTSLKILANWISGSDGNGVAGMELIKVGSGTVALPKPRLLSDPVSDRYLVGDTPTFSVKGGGINYTAQWYKNGAAIKDATNLTYTTPALVAGDDQAKFHITLSNASGSVTSADAVVSIGKLVDAPGFLTREYWSGKLRLDVEDSAFADATTQPNSYYAAFETPTNQGDNYTERVSGLFTPPVTGDYVFFVCSDDDSDLFLSTDETTANLRLVASEDKWSNSRQWVSSGGGSDLTGKRSDTAFPTGIHLVAGKYYAIQGVHHEGGGGDDFAATFKLLSEPDPKDGDAPKIAGALVKTKALDGSSAAITTQPSSTTVVQDRKGTLSVVATSSFAGNPRKPELYYQWYKKAPSDSGFTSILGATSATYTTPVLELPDSGTQYQVVVSVLGFSVTSAPATITVIPDTFPPIAQVGAVQRNGSVQIGVSFDEPVTQASASVAGNYTLQGGTISSVAFVTNDTGVVITASGLAEGGKYSLTVKGVTDLHNNSMTSTNISFTVQDTAWASVGAPSIPAAVVPVGDNGYDVISGGKGFWSTYDELTFVYKKMTNDFDVRVQIVEQDFSSEWARGGLQVREATDEGKTADDVTGGYNFSAYREIHANANGTTGDQNQTSNNSFEANRRVGVNYGATANDTSGWGGGGPAPSYPDVWLRLQRKGTNFFGFRSTDGTTWTQIASDSWAAPSVLLVGPGYSPENGNAWKDAVNYRAYMIQYRNFGPTPSASAIGKFTGITYNADGTVTLTWDGAGTLQAGATPGGPWQDVTGAKSPYNFKPAANALFGRLHQ